MPKGNYAELNIHQKILKIADAAGILQKTKAGFNYKYVPEEEIQAKVTANMQKYGVMLYHFIRPGSLQLLPYTYQKFDKKANKEIPVNEVIVHADTVYLWVNTDNPEEKLEIPWIIIGQMEDASQAFGAAETFCNRYFLMKSLQLATTEADPDNYRSKQKEAESYETAKLQQKEKETLATAVKEVVDCGTKLMKSGIKKDIIMGIVGKYNGGNQNPSSIKSLEICAAVMKDFKSLQAEEKNDAPKVIPETQKKSSRTKEAKRDIQQQ